MTDHRDPYARGPIEAEVDVYMGSVLIRLHRRKDYGGGGRREQIAYFHSGDVNEVIAALESVMVEMMKAERKVERAAKREATKPPAE